MVVVVMVVTMFAEMMIKILMMMVIMLIPVMVTMVEKIMRMMVCSILPRETMISSFYLVPPYLCALSHPFPLSSV